MAWQKRTYRLTGVAPQIQHNGQTADPMNKFAKALKKISAKRKKVDADHAEMARIEFLAALYLDEDGNVIVPAENIAALILAAAKKQREGPVAKSGIMITEHAQLDYDGRMNGNGRPLTPDEMWEDGRFTFTKLVRVQSSRVSRTRAILNDWTAIVNVEYEDTLTNERQVDQWMDIAGTQIGLLDWRPRYGRFDADVIT
jgi:hypothetical protein